MVSCPFCTPTLVSQARMCSSAWGMETVLAMDEAVRPEALW
mgnify:CR=1 FL=1